MKLLLAIACLVIALGDAAPRQPAAGPAESKRLLEELVDLIEPSSAAGDREESPRNYPLEHFGSDERRQEAYRRIECEYYNTTAAVRLDQYAIVYQIIVQTCCI